MTMANRYIEAAKRMFACNPDVDVLDIVDESPDDGAWVTALIWISDDEPEPSPAPAQAGDDQ